MTKPLRQQAAFGDARSTGLAAVLAKLERRKSKTDLLVGTSEISRKEVADVRLVVKDEKVWLDVADARQTKLKNLRDEVDASAATLCKKLLHVQKRLTAAL